MRGAPQGETDKRVSSNERAISTVLDISLCLLLVGASAATLAGTPVVSDPTARGGSDASIAGLDAPTAGPDTADEAADLLATSTARVSYEADGAGARDTGTESRARNRTVHDTLAGLLASAARADAESASARRPTAAPTPFVRAVTARVGRAIRRLDAAVQVIARLPSAEPDSTPGGRVTAGPAPPPDADVHAASFAVRGVAFTVRTWST